MAGLLVVAVVAAAELALVVVSVPLAAVVVVVARILCQPRQTSKLWIIVLTVRVVSTVDPAVDIRESDGLAVRDLVSDLRDATDDLLRLLSVLLQDLA